MKHRYVKNWCIPVPDGADTRIHRLRRRYKYLRGIVISELKRKENKSDTQLARRRHARDTGTTEAQPEPSRSPLLTLDRYLPFLISSIERPATRSSPATRSCARAATAAWSRRRRHCLESLPPLSPPPVAESASAASKLMESRAHLEEELDKERQANALLQEQLQKKNEDEAMYKQQIATLMQRNQAEAKKSKSDAAKLQDEIRKLTGLLKARDEEDKLKREDMQGMLKTWDDRKAAREAPTVSGAPLSSARTRAAAAAAAAAGNN